MNRKIIDINADVGVGIGNEALLMPYLSSCNIACGGHAGSVTTMATVVKLAKQNNVKVGAHPSFPDIENFGRVAIKISSADLYSSLKKQVFSLQNELHSESEVLHHIKPHGALYNLAAIDVKTAQVIIEVIKSISLPIKLYAPYKSVVADLALKENIEVTFEAFADRNYNEDLSLVSRQNLQALIVEKEAVFNHVFHMISTQKVKALNGVEVPIKASTICVHGDTKNAVEILSFLSQELYRNNISIQ